MDMSSKKSLAFQLGEKIAEEAAGIASYGPTGSAIGAAGGAALGTYAGAQLGELFAKQTPRHMFNIPLPGTQRVENEHGRLAGGILGGLAGGALGFYGGGGAGEALTRSQEARRREQKIQEMLYAQSMARHR